MIRLGNNQFRANSPGSGNGSGGGGAAPWGVRVPVVVAQPQSRLKRSTAKNAPFSPRATGLVAGWRPVSEASE